MKIEIGESLMLSYLKHVKKCIFYQTNWKVSSNWGVSKETFDKVKIVYDKIINHPEFYEVFKSKLDQLIKQSEIDVIGMDSSNFVYTGDIAFHEDGLNYGDKIETKNRVIKKLLRSYLTLLAYFPNRKYELIFASPKVNPTSDIIISNCFSVLQKDFTDENVSFKYLSNKKFFENILKPTISISINDSDTNELFIRSIILNKLFEINKMKSNNDDTSESISKSIHSKNELILEFEPIDQKIFKQELIKTKKARRIIFYKGHRIEEQIWNANNFTKEANLIANIRGNNKIRQWKKLGIVRVRFEIIYD